MCVCVGVGEGEREKKMRAERYVAKQYLIIISCKEKREREYRPAKMYRYWLVYKTNIFQKHSKVVIPKILLHRAENLKKLVLSTNVL